ncbi:F-box and leucine-rich protein 22 [Brachyhypopomus gauderio]|uniref:F-box and leucine-rich protein 22 n=1 Tax=Brachyhypopomus gauderio TaxID=698409 RepID=UPI004042A889
MRLPCIRKRPGRSHVSRPCRSHCSPSAALVSRVRPQASSQPEPERPLYHLPFYLYLFFSLLGMQLTDLNQECLLHLFSFLDKDARKSLSLTCVRLREAFLDPRLWSLLHFCSPCELRRNNFILSPSLRFLDICWHSSRVKVCNIEYWMKTAFQRDLCSKHESLVSDFLERVCNICPNLQSLTLSGCGHVTDHDVTSVLRHCKRLQRLCLENCCQVTDAVLQAAVVQGGALMELRVDFCRNISQAGLQAVRQTRPGLWLSAERSAGMIPDSRPEQRLHSRRSLQKVLTVS